MTEYFDVIAQSSTGIFHSALALAPETSIIRKLYGRDPHLFTRVVRGIPDAWDWRMASAKCPSPIETVTWSPCGRLIAITCTDSTTQILDGLTLEQLCTMRSFLGERVLAFSPDSRLLLCCGLSIDSLTNFIVSWDVQTGGMVRVREIEEQAKGTPSAVTLSVDGNTIGVAYFYRSAPNKFTICVYGIDSGRCVFAHSFNEFFIKFWTCERSFRFAAANQTINVREIDLSSDSRFESVETLRLPADFSPLRSVSFLPDIRRLAYVTEGAVQISDAQSGKLLFGSRDTSFYRPTIAFSSDGRFIACKTTGTDAYFWEGSPTDYILHRKVTSGTLYPVPLFSPDDTTFVTWSSSTIWLWLLVGPSTLTSHNPPHIGGPPEHFLLDFRPGGGSAVVYRRKDNTVAIFDLETGIKRLTIHAGMEVYGLRVFGDTIVVEGWREFVTWILPVGDSVPGAVVSVESSVRRTTIQTPRNLEPQSASAISPDLLLIAVLGSPDTVVRGVPLFICNVSTGDILTIACVAGDMMWFSQDGSQIWCDGEVGEEQGWRVLENSG